MAGLMLSYAHVHLPELPALHNYLLITMKTSSIDIRELDINRGMNVAAMLATISFQCIPMFSVLVWGCNWILIHT